MKKTMKHMKKKLQSKGGFTLVELIVVIVIMGILTAALVPTVTGYISDAKVKVSESNERMVKQAALLYLTDWEENGQETEPTSIEISALVSKGYLSGTDDALENKVVTFTKENGSNKYTIEITESPTDETGDN